MLISGFVSVGLVFVLFFGFCFFSGFSESVLSFLLACSIGMFTTILAGVGGRGGQGKRRSSLLAGGAYRSLLFLRSADPCEQLLQKSRPS